jgi:magnesium and cobalt transporter
LGYNDAIGYSEYHHGMSEEDSNETPPQRTWLERLGQAFSGEPRNRQELLEELRTAQVNGLVSSDTLAMMEGALAVSDKQVSDVMVARSRMVTLSASATLTEVLAIVVESGHSRFPVTGDTQDQIIGILLAKDLLKCFTGSVPISDIHKLIRQVSLITESKRLNVLLKEFRASRNHMAIVVNEFGGVAGLVTIEDVLEEIVGDISDEHDDDDPSAMIQALADGRYLVSALTPIDEFNDRFNTQFSSEEFDTVGGVITAAVGHLPVSGEKIDLAGLHFKVTRADPRKLIQLSVRVINAA